MRMKKKKCFAFRMGLIYLSKTSQLVYSYALAIHFIPRLIDEFVTQGREAEGLPREEVQEAPGHRQDVRPPRRQALGRRDRHEGHARRLQVHPDGRPRVGRQQARPGRLWHQQAPDYVHRRGREGCYFYIFFFVTFG